MNEHLKKSKGKGEIRLQPAIDNRVLLLIIKFREFRVVQKKFIRGLTYKTNNWSKINVKYLEWHKRWHVSSKELGLIFIHQFLANIYIILFVVTRNSFNSFKMDLSSMWVLCKNQSLIIYKKKRGIKREKNENAVICFS